MVGLFQGGVQALSRSYFGRIIPKEKSNEYYGFFDIFGRYASVMGTFLVSVVTSLTGNPSLGVLSIGVLLVVGFVLLVRLSRMSQTAGKTGHAEFASNCVRRDTLLGVIPINIRLSNND